MYHSSHREKLIYSKFNATFKRYEQETPYSSTSANPEWIDNIFAYVVMGLPPGSFYSAVFANDLIRAAACSHPLNQWTDIQMCCNWLGNYAPKECYGSWDNVKKWQGMTPDARTPILEQAGLLLTAWELLQK